ncbi:MAG: DUF2490 domain-containing protein [Planctomycetota bacterium]|jgi:hypothetical protein
MKATQIRKKNRATACLFVVLAFVAYNSRSCFASIDGDFQFWSTAGVSFDINKDWKVAVEEKLKFVHDAGHLRYHHTDLGFTYKGLADWIDLGFNFKQVFVELPDDDWSRENRPHLNITFKGRWAGLDFSDKSKFAFRDIEYGDDYWRYSNKLKVNLPYELTRFKFRPYVADQVYINMDRSNFEKNRLYAGVSFELSKNIESELYYVYQWGKFLDYWFELSALGLQLKLSF